MILKTIIIFGGGYLLYRIVKASLKNTLLGMVKPRQMKEPAELIQCVECQKFVDGENVIYRRKMAFCGDECLNKHFSKDL